MIIYWPVVVCYDSFLTFCNFPEVQFGDSFLDDKTIRLQEGEWLMQRNEKRFQDAPMLSREKKSFWSSKIARIRFYKELHIFASLLNI